MQHYDNHGGDSGVAAFDVGEGWIHVRFRDGAVYRYTDRSAGVAAIRTMQRLAKEGRGLNGFISQVVKTGFETKVR